MSKIEALLLLCMSTGAFLMPFICRRLNLPSSVGEILFGLGIGYFLHDAVHQTTIIKFLSEFGFILLMYLAGLEINFEKIKVTPLKHLLLYISLISLIVLLSFAVMLCFKQPPLFALVYLTTAIGLLFPVLKETRLLHNDSGQRLLIIGSIGEIVTLIALTFYILYYRFGISFQSLFHLVQLLAFIFVAYFIYKVYRLIVWWYPALVRPFLDIHNPVESGIRTNFVNMFIFVALAALLDMELIVGAFLGGMTFALIFKKRQDVANKIGGFAYGFLIPMFFIEVGFRFNITQFFNLQVLLRALLIAFIIFIVRALASLVLLFSHLPFREIIIVPFSLSFPLTLLAAIATFGLENNILQESQAAAILLAAILTAFIFPFIIKNIIKKMAKQAEKTVIKNL